MQPIKKLLYISDKSTGTNKMLKTVHYDTLKSGKHLVIFGAVHGNETCGTKAILKLIDDIEKGNIILKSGTLTLVPVCNPRAYQQNVRFVQRNLNRNMYPKSDADITHYEDSLDNPLCKIIESADILLDLHSYETTGTEFSFLGRETPYEIEFCLSLGIEKFVYGWSEAFSKANQNPRESMGTTEYARTFKIPATTVECGQHDDIHAPDIAYRTIKYALQYCDISDFSDLPVVKKYQFTKMQTVFYREKSGDLMRDFKHYDTVSAGDIIATYHDGQTIIAPSDGVIILPKIHAHIGAEWFYFGIKTECPPSKF